MDWFYITTAALPRLSLVLLTSVMLGYFASRVRKAPGTIWLVVAMVGFTVHHASFAAYNVLYMGDASRVLTPLTWSSAVLSTWAFIGVAYGFRSAGYTPTARRVLIGTGGAAVAVVAFLHVGFPSPAVSGSTVQLVGMLTVMAFSIGTFAILTLEARRLRREASRANDPSRKALRTFGAVILSGLVIPVVGLFRDAGVVSAALDEQVALVMWSIVMMGLITLYVNYDPEPTSFVVKVVAFGFLAVVTSLGVASVVVFSETVPAEGDSPQPLAYVPEGNQYRVEDGEALDLEVGDPIEVGDGEVARVRLGFAFPFAGQTWSEVLVDDDGYVSFGPDTLQSYWDIVEGSSIGWIAPMYMGLSPASGDVSIARSPEGAVISWRDVPGSTVETAVTLQLRLLENGTFSFAYGEVPEGPAVVQRVLGRR